MKNAKGLVLENSKGKVIRYLSSEEDTICVVLNKETRRLHLVADKQVDVNDENLHKISIFSADQVAKSPLKIADGLTVRQSDSKMNLKSEVAPRPEDEDQMPLFLKYSVAGHVAGVVLVVGVSWVINYFFPKQSEPIVVQVYKQDVREPKRPEPPVQASKKKINPQQISKKAKISNRTRIAKNPTNARRKANHNQRAGAPGGMNQGALGVLGGFSKQFNGSGGLNVNAAKNNPGVGYGGAAARGGHSRGLVGKGLVAGVGSSGSVRGYGGYGTEGKGGGRPGYGNRKMGGSHSGGLYALSEEALVEGGLDMDQINAVVKRNMGQLRQCYERGLQKHRSLAGQVNVKFTISGAGSVSTAAVSSTSLGKGSVESCLVGKLRGWRFPRPVGNVSVRVDYPFVFDRNG